MSEIKLNVSDIAQLGARLDGVSLSPDERAFLDVVLGQAASAFVDVQGYTWLDASVGRGVQVDAGLGGANVSADLGAGGASLFTNLLGGFGAGAELSSNDGSTSIIIVGG